jgi:hypothetical protein
VKYTDKLIKTYRSVTHDPLTFSVLKTKTAVGPSALKRALDFWIELGIIEKVDLPKPSRKERSGRNFPRYGYKKVQN